MVEIQRPRCRGKWAKECKLRAGSVSRLKAYGDAVRVGIRGRAPVRHTAWERRGGRQAGEGAGGGERGERA
jgi:hypothetical protein